MSLLEHNNSSDYHLALLFKVLKLLIIEPVFHDFNHFCYFSWALFSFLHILPKALVAGIVHNVFQPLHYYLLWSDTYLNSLQKLFNIMRIIYLSLLKKHKTCIQRFHWYNTQITSTMYWDIIPRLNVKTQFLKCILRSKDLLQYMCHGLIEINYGPAAENSCSEHVRVTRIVEGGPHLDPGRPCLPPHRWSLDPPGTESPRCALSPGDTPLCCLLICILWST